MSEHTFPLISVIVPIYKVDRYLRRCLDSIARQTYENLEVLLVDDGSPDESPAICDAYAREDPRFRVIHKQNGGLSSARNAALDAMRGQLVAFVDGDDYLAPKMFEALYARMIADGTKLAICNIQRVDDLGNERPGPKWELADAVLDEAAFWKIAFEKNNTVCVVAWNKLYRAELFEGVRFDVGKVHEDQLILHKIIGQCERISCVSDRLYFYVIREGSFSKLIPLSIHHLDSAEALIARALYLREKGYGALAESCLMSSKHVFSRVRRFLPNPSKGDREQLSRMRCRFRDARRELVRGGVSPRFFWYSLFLSGGFGFYSAAQRVLPKAKKRLRALLRRMGCGGLRRAAREALAYAGIRLRIARIHCFTAQRRCVCFPSTPTHGNLGDQAIVRAQIKLVEDMGLKRNIVEIHDAQYRRWKRSLERALTPRDVLIIGGGGSIGTLWPEEEAKMRDILQRFPQNRVFIFPQTAFFSDDDAGRAAFRETVRIHGAHGHLRIYARDMNTHRLLGEALGDRVAATPDIVPYIGAVGERADRTEALLCLREDRERTTTGEQDARLEACLRALNLPIRRTSMLVRRTVTARTRERELRDKWREFSKAKIVVTDRLHGMIFAALTGTPCVALDNVSRKLREGYFWLKHLPYIRFCESVDEVEEAAREALSVGPGEFDRAPLERHYDMMKEELRRALE